MKPRLTAGNWKMNGLSRDLAEITKLIPAIDSANRCDVLICPPATLIAPMKAVAEGTGLLVGAQDCHQNQSGAHTGEISVAMLAEAGATHVITGHSERRADHGETDTLVRAKTVAAIKQGLCVIVCVGETRDERQAGATLEVVEAQLRDSLPDESSSSRVIVAYEPVWAIGSGLTATLEQIAEVHAFMREYLTSRFGSDGANVSLLYGGSVGPRNAAGIFALEDVDGALVGGASLKASDFSRIVRALDESAR